MEDLQLTEWIDRDWNNANDICTESKVETSQFEPDLVLGSALIYSAEGALFCADTIYHFISGRDSREAWVLQMPERPGFDVFLRRLQHLELTCKRYNISRHVYDIACNEISAIKSPRESFALYVIK